MTYAQRTSRVLEGSGISSMIVRTPTEVATQGCGYSVRISEKNLTNALIILKNANLTPNKVYIAGINGGFSEVRL